MNALKRLLLLTTACAALASARAEDADAAPRIAGMRLEAGRLWVAVDVPAGTLRVTLETRPRLGDGTWTPRRVEWLDGAAGTHEWPLDPEGDMVLVRVRREAGDDLPLPAAFYAGRREFDPLVTSNAAPPTVSGPVDSVDAGFTGDRGAETGREVVESDIWRLDGSTLYFFNAVRGLQVIDVADPDVPVLVATLPLAGRGEQMYLLPPRESDAGARWLALLTQDDCGGTSSTVRLVRHAGSALVPGPALPVTGSIRESRLVGTALYLAAADSFARPTQTVTNANGTVSVIAAEWRTETVLTGYDLADPAAPGQPDIRRIPAAPNAIAATPRSLWVATTEVDAAEPDQPWYLRTQTQRVLRFDITDPAGSIRPDGSATVKGRVADKFKLHEDGDILTVVSQEDGLWRPAADPSRGWVFLPPRTWLETFRWESGATAPLAGIQLVENESLFATRFVGKRAYVVTFRQIDPLWIVDLTDPAKPEIRGELQIPGYSSYLEPLGEDRLVAMGVEGGNATVALFDVADDRNPRQITKVFLGSGWSWSEANSDEKAFRLLPDLGLALVPWQGYDGERWTQAVQLIDFTRDSLRLRGVVRHAMQPRRATVVDDRILSVSSRELLAVDFSDRDHPAVTGDLELGFRVDRLALLGTDRLIEVAYDAADFGGTGFAPEVRIAPRSQPAAATGRLALPAGQVVGVAVEGTRVHVLQFQPELWTEEDQVTTREDVVQTPEGPRTVVTTVTNRVPVTVPGWLETTVLECSGPAPVQVGSARTVRPSTYWGESMTAFFTAADAVVWTEQRTGYSGYPWWYWGPVFDATAAARPASKALRPVVGIWWPGMQSRRHLVAFRLAPDGAPSPASTTAMPGSDTRHTYSPATAVGARLFFTHRETLTREPAKQEASKATGDGLWITPPAQWVPPVYETRFHLDVVDFADPGQPVVRPPVPVPGDLLGVDFGGALLVTASDTRWDTNGVPTQPLHALAYDGVAVSQVAVLEEPGIQSWHGGTGARVVGLRPGRSGDPGAVPTALVPRRLGGGGTWESLPPVAVADGTYEVRRFGDLLVTGSAAAFEFHRTDPEGALERLGRTARACSWWFNWDHADGSVAEGLWVPLGELGLEHLVPAP